MNRINVEDARVLAMAIAVALVLATSPGLAAAANCGTGIISPALAHTLDSSTAHAWGAPGGGAGCALTNAMGTVTGMVDSNKLAIMSANSTYASVMFNCGPRGSCTIRGTDGLPVELLSFGVE